MVYNPSSAMVPPEANGARKKARIKSSKVGLNRQMENNSFAIIAYNSGGYRNSEGLGRNGSSGTLVKRNS